MWMFGSTEPIEGSNSVFATLKKYLETDGPKSDFDVCTVFLISFSKLAATAGVEGDVDQMRERRPPDPDIAKRHFAATMVRKTRPTTNADSFTKDQFQSDYAFS